MTVTVWVAGQYRGDGEPWDIQGVFSTEEKAVAACRTPDYFVGPLTLDAELPHEVVPDWPGSYYPMEDNAHG